MLCRLKGLLSLVFYFIFIFFYYFFIFSQSAVDQGRLDLRVHAMLSCRLSRKRPLYAERFLLVEHRCTSALVRTLVSHLYRTFSHLTDIYFTNCDLYLLGLAIYFS